MKKLDFYTRKMENSAPRAVLVSGYTDGTYNYYRLDGGFWCAVHVFAGLAIPTSSNLPGIRLPLPHMNTRTQSIKISLPLIINH